MFLPGLVLVALAALSSCTDAIFATIEAERKVTTNTLPLNISIFDVATSVPLTPGGPYFVAGGGVFKGTFNSGGTLDWNPSDTSRPLNPSGLLCNSMVYYPPTATLWGGFITSSGAVPLYQSTGGLTFAGQTPVNDPAINTKQTVLLQVAHGHLFMVSTLDTSTYELDYNLNGASLWVANFLSALPYPITGVVWDGVNYWAASAANLYTTSIDPPISTSFASATSPVPHGDTINGIFADSTSGRVFLATKANGIYWSVRGASWNHIDHDQVGSVIVSNLCVAGPADGATADKYLVGSDGYGYYTLSISGNNGSGSISRFGDSTILLYSASVSRILVDGVNVLMGTNYRGLWRAVFDTTMGALASGQSWTHENRES